MACVVGRTWVIWYAAAWGVCLAMGWVGVPAAKASTRTPVHARVVHTRFPTHDVVIANAVATQPPFNAPADGRTDATAAIQKALNAVAKAGGGVVFLPAGRYFCRGHLTIPQSVTLRGDWRAPTRQKARVGGTILMPVADAGQARGKPFIRLRGGTGIFDLTIFYPRQRPRHIVAYPWTLESSNSQVMVKDVTLVNSYQGIGFAKTTAKHTICQVYGTPLKQGIWVHECVDIGRIEDTHFSPRYWLQAGLTSFGKDQASALKRRLMNHGTGLTIERSDWEYAFDLTVHGYHRGVVMNGNTNGVYYQLNVTGNQIGYQVRKANIYGLAISNSRLGGSAAALAAGPEFTGSIQLNNCVLIGTNGPAATLAGSGRMSLQNCTFSRWRRAAVAATKGKVDVLGCRFAEAGTDVQLGAGVARARIMGNRYAGQPRVKNKSHGDVLVMHHDFHFTRISDKPITLPPDRAPATDKLFNVVAFGADSSGKQDATDAFQKALDAAGRAGGGTVYVPSGHFLIAGHLHVPTGVELRGSFDQPHYTSDPGSILLPTGDPGKAQGPAMIQLAAHSGVRGLTIWYPKQRPVKVTPYPWTIRSRGKGCWVIDVDLANAYQGVDMASYPSDGHLLRAVEGQPLKTGIEVGKGSGAVVDCHFNPGFFLHSKSLPAPAGAFVGGKKFVDSWAFILKHLNAFVFKDCPHELQVNNFAYAVDNGLILDGCGGRVINWGSDNSRAGVTVRRVAKSGIEMVNTQLTAFGAGTIGCFHVTRSFSGRLLAANTLCWAHQAPTALLRGSGTVVLQQFNTLERKLYIDSGHVRLINGVFKLEGPPQVFVAGSGSRVDLIDVAGHGGFTYRGGRHVRQFGTAGKRIHKSGH